VPGQKRPVRHDIRLNRLTLGACGALIAGEASVALWLNPTAGILLIICTATLLVGIQSTQLVASRSEPAPEPAIDPRSLFLDEATGLPNHQRLIEEVRMGIARTQRYGTLMTTVRVEVDRLAGLRAAWGAEVAAEAVVHTAAVLRRVTRASDFVASLGDGRFVALLMQCDGQQGGAFASRVALAAANRPLESEDGWRLPLYVAVKGSVLEFDPARHRGPFDFLAEAGCDAVPQRPEAVGTQARRSAARVAEERPELAPVRDYYADDAPAPDFAEAYRDHLKRRTG